MAVKKKAAIKGIKAKKTVARKNPAKAKAKKAMAPTARGSALKKASAANPAFSSSPITEKQTKAQIFAELAEITGLGKSDIKNVFSGLRNIVERHLKGKGFGEFVIPDLGIKVRRIHKAATKARMGRNPFTGEEIQIPAKPARKSVKATALKALKEIVLA